MEEVHKYDEVEIKEYDDFFRLKVIVQCNDPLSYIRNENTNLLVGVPDIKYKYIKLIPNITIISNIAHSLDTDVYFTLSKNEYTPPSFLNKLENGDTVFIKHVATYTGHAVLLTTRDKTEQRNIKLNKILKKIKNDY